MNIRTNRVVVVALCLGLYAAVPISAQNADAISRRLDALEKASSVTQSEIRELSAFLRAAIPSPVEEIDPIQLNLEGAQAKGSADAAVVLVEFSDFECPFCSQHFRAAYPQVLKQFVETGQVRYIFKNLPLEPIHPNASHAAEAAQCAGEQKKFWEMHDRLFANQKLLTKSDLRNHAQQLGLHMGEYEACIARGDMARRVQDDLVEAKRLGLTGTPTFLIGRKSGKDLVFTHKVTGAHPLHVFRIALHSPSE